MQLNRRLTPMFVTCAIAILTSCFSESEPDVVGRQECERLRDHLVELRMNGVSADHEQHRNALRSALGDSFVIACVERTTPSHVRCALAATDSDTLLACSTPTSP